MASFRFGPFEVDIASGELHKYGRKIRLQEKPFAILVQLLERQGEVATREDLQQLLWPADTFVDFDHNLNNSINRLREALNDSVEKPKYIETLPRRGYRFKADVEVTRVELPAAKTAATATLPNGNPLATPAGAATEVPLSPRRTWWPAGAAVALILLAVVLTQTDWWKPEHTVPTVQTEGPLRLLVLPFINLTGESQQEYFCDGMTEEMIAQLSNLIPDRLHVIARTSAMRYKDSTKHIAEIAGEVNANYVLESSVRKSGGRYRISVQLIRARDQTHVWAEEYDREIRDILDAQQEVALAVARSVGLQLTPAESSRLHSTRPIDPEAYENYLKGRYFWAKRDPESLQKAYRYMQAAIARDPGFARAYGGLADCYVSLAYGYVPASQAFAKGREAAEKALQLDENLAEAHTTLGYLLFAHGWDWPGAEREFRRAIELDPGYANGHHWFALFLNAMGRRQEAIREIGRATDLDPLSSIVRSNQGEILIHARQYGLAIETLQKTLEFNPDFGIAHGLLAMAYELSGKYSEAITEYERARVLEDDLYYAGIAHAYAAWGKRAEALAALGKLEATARKKYVSQLSFVIVYAGLKDNNKAFSCLKQTLQNREASVPLLRNTDPRLDGLRKDPRFEPLLKEFETRP